VDLETVERTARSQKLNKSPGADGFPRELYKYGVPALHVLLWRAINAYLRGETPDVCAHEWLGAIASSIPKQLAALLVTEFRPIACICAKYSILLKILDVRLNHAVEDNGIIDDAQEAFRPGRSPKRQLAKVHNILHHQRKRQESLSVILYLDIKNAFNAINHRAIFSVFEACGFPTADVALLRRMYTGSFLVMKNKFGKSAACMLSRGVMQGAQPSPRIYGVVFNPIQVLIRFLKRRWTATDDIDPSGASVFADDTAAKTDGPDAVPAMCHLVQAVCPVLEWTGQLVQTKKTKIVGVDMKTGKSIATDSITLNGEPFTVLLPDEPHKHLGVRMTMLGDFAAEKDHVRQEMRRRLAALKEDRVLSRPEKELVIVTAVCSVFRYSAGIVDWTKTELDDITKSWISAFKQAWSLPLGSDGSPMILPKSDSGRECPTAADICTAEALDTLEQCLGLPGEIAQIVRQYLYLQCTANGCHALNQLQQLIKVRGTASSPLEMLLQRLNSQGLEISSPWANITEQLILEAVWPEVHKAWAEKEQWAGCTELDEPIQADWIRAKQCLQACQKLGRAEPAILTVQQLRGSQSQWLQITELKHRKCHLTPDELLALGSHLSQTDKRQGLQSQDHLRPPPVIPLPAQQPLSTRTAPVIPPCIIGSVQGVTDHDQQVLHSILHDIPDIAISDIPDRQLVAHLCNKRAIFSLPHTATGNHTVECLLPLRKVISPYPFREELTIARSTTDDAAPLTVLQTALVRDCLLEDGSETLHEACNRHPWIVRPADRFAGHFFPSGIKLDALHPAWKLNTANSDGQTTISSLVQYFSTRRKTNIQYPPVPLHLWQLGPALPHTVVIDTSHHTPAQLPSPDGWTVMKRNGRVWIAEGDRNVTRMDAAHYSMITDLNSQKEQPSPSVQLLQLINASSRAQQQSDLEHHVHWSRHLLAYIQKVTEAQLLIGASAMTYNPHFHFFVSPNSTDRLLGASVTWPLVPALLLLDSFMPSARSAILRQAAAHAPGVWILRKTMLKNADADLPDLLHLRAQLCIELPGKSRVVHKDGCWEEAQWDTFPAHFKTQLWHTPGSPTLKHSMATSASKLRQHLNRWESRQYDFHWHEDPVPPPLVLYRKYQQDAIRATWQGLVAGTDGSVDLRSERMGAGYAIGDGPIPIRAFSAPVGGPLASIRPEAASLLQILRDVAANYDSRTPLLIFVDCLVLLDILNKWGRQDFHPNPKDVVHFDIITPLLTELRQWPGQITLVKIKSHSGCLMNELADELADKGKTADQPELCPGPQKYGSFWLRIKQTVRTQAAECKKQLPRDSAPNKSILKQVAKVNILRAMKLRRTIFVTNLLHRRDAFTVSQVIQRCKTSEYRVWLKSMEGIYPVQTYLHRIGKAASPLCPHCSSGVDETFTHFTSVCPKFREARTSAHNQVRRVITTFLARNIGHRWKMFEEKSLKSTGLVLRPVSATSIARARSQPTADPNSEQDLGRWQPDWILVSDELKKIAILDLCRPSDVHPAQLTAAAIRKQDGYSPLVEALDHYTGSGWTVHVFPWVVGTRGLIDPSHIHALLDFLEIPGKCRKLAVERTVLASVKALYFMHQVRFGGLYGRRKTESKCHCDTSDSENTDDEELLTTPSCQRQRTSPKVTVAPAPHSSNNNGEPIPANPANPLSPPGEHAVPPRDGGTVDTPHAPALHHLLHPPCCTSQEAPKRQRLNPAQPLGTAAPPILPEQLVTSDHDPLSVRQQATSTANWKVASEAAAVDKETRPPTRTLDTNDPLRQMTRKRLRSPGTCQDDPWTRWRRLNGGGRGGT